MKKYTMHVLSHTHWDREWYQSFQGYRRRLVFQMDAMMDLLEKRPTFPAFHLDAQTSVLFDYLQIRPDQRARLAKHVRSGRILVGPWFTMPDESLLSAESIIRNLQLGCRHCREWGAKPSPIGWLSDIFSHISQLPQILAGFGYDNAFMHHGTPCTGDETTEMVWEGADGTETLILKAYPWFGYQDFLQLRYRTRDELRDWERKKIALASTNILLGLDGNDHEPAKWDTPEVIARMNKLFAQTRVVHSTMPRYLAALRKALGKNWQRGRKRFVGELRTPSKIGNWNGLTNGTGSSRLPLKQANDAQEILLARLAEPFNAWATLLGGEPQHNYLDLAWQYLFLNHPHDSICGCSIDQPHRDMLYRFDQSRMLAQDSLEASIQEIGDRINLSGFSDADYAVTVFNPCGVLAGTVNRFSFEIPSALVAQKRAQGLVPVLLSVGGKPAHYDILQVERTVTAQPFMYQDRGMSPAIWRRAFAVDRYHVASISCIPPLGYSTYGIAFRKPIKQKPASKRANVVVNAAQGFLENALFRLVVRKDGSVDLHDKEARATYRGIHFFENCGDAGDGWNHRYPTNDTVILSTNKKSRSKVRITKEYEGALTASLKVSFSLRVPADLATKSASVKRNTARSRKSVWLPIETVFTMDAVTPRIHCRTTVNNTARRHRLRVLFPTNRKTNVWFGDTACDIVRRNIKLRNTTGWNEHDREENIIKNFAAVCDKRAGLAVITKGINEAAVQDKPSRPIALTLFRGFIERLMNQETEDSLLPGKLTMEYALVPFVPQWSAPPANLLWEVERFKFPLPSYTRPASGAPVDETLLPPYNEKNPPQPAPSVGTNLIPPSKKLAAILATRPKLTRDLPPAGSLLILSDNLTLSTVKTSEDGTAIIARLWNPHTRSVKGFLRPMFKFSRVSQTDLLEKPCARLAVKDKSIPLALRAKEILTIRFDR